MAKFGAYGTILRIGDGTTGAAKVLTAATTVGTTATFTSAAHGFVAGDLVVVTGVTPSGYNGTWVVVTAALNTFTVVLIATQAAGTVFGTATKQDVFTSIAQISDVGGPGLAMDTIDVTTHDSPDAWREFIAGLKDAGEVSLDLVYDPDSVTQTALRNDLDSRVTRNFQIVFPDLTATTWNFAAKVTAFEPTASVEDALMASVTLKVTGRPNLA